MKQQRLLHIQLNKAIHKEENKQRIEETGTTDHTNDVKKKKERKRKKDIVLFLTSLTVTKKKPHQKWPKIYLSSV